MSDFTSGFWNIYIVVLTLIGIVGCGVLLWSQSKHKVVLKPGTSAETATTGHLWDEDLTELNTPMPRWCMWSTKAMKSAGVPCRRVGAKSPMGW